MFDEAARGLAMLRDKNDGKPYWRRTASGGLQPEPFRAAQVLASSRGDAATDEDAVDAAAAVREHYRRAGRFVGACLWHGHALRGVTFCRFFVRRVLVDACRATLRARRHRGLPYDSGAAFPASLGGGTLAPGGVWRVSSPEPPPSHRPLHEPQPSDDADGADDADDAAAGGGDGGGGAGTTKRAVGARDVKRARELSLLVGASERTSAEGECELPGWLMDALGLDDGDDVDVEPPPRACNRAGAPVEPPPSAARGGGGLFGGGGVEAVAYCGRRLGPSAIPGSDGRCGPNNGPACADCRALAAPVFARVGDGDAAFEGRVPRAASATPVAARVAWSLERAPGSSISPRATSTGGGAADLVSMLRAGGGGATGGGGASASALLGALLAQPCGGLRTPTYCGAGVCCVNVGVHVEPRRWFGERVRLRRQRATRARAMTSQYSEIRTSAFLAGAPCADGRVVRGRNGARRGNRVGRDVPRGGVRRHDAARADDRARSGRVGGGRLRRRRFLLLRLGR